MELLLLQLLITFKTRVESPYILVRRPLGNVIRKIRPQGRDHSHVAQMRRSCYAYSQFFSPSTIRLSALIGCSRCSTRSAAQKIPRRVIHLTISGERAKTHTGISVAVAGFTEADLAIEVKENTVTIRGQRQANADEDAGELFHRGIAARDFERRFQLADYVSVKNANLENGLSARRPRARDPGGDEAPGNPDHGFQ